MAGSSSISGLASGLDTATIIEQLMQLEAVPQGRLKTQQSNEQAIQTALRTLNTTTAKLSTTAATLADSSTWQTLKGTATGSDIAVTVGAKASASSFSVTVDRRALTHQVAFTDAASLTDVVAGGSVTVTTSDGTEHDISTGGGTLTEVVAALNAASPETGIKATAVRVADGSYRLLTESTSTGQASSFTLTNGDGTDLLGGTTVRAGQDAQINLGLGITATSSSNTFDEIIPGVSLTLNPTATTGTTASVSVAQDPTSITTTVKGLVEQVNALLSAIDTQTAAKTTSTAAGVLAGNATARSLRNQVLETVFGGTTSMSSLGLQTDRYGKLVFSEDTFKAAYAADPAAVAAKFTTGETNDANGWAARVAAVTKAASNTTTGSLTSAVTGRSTTIDTLTRSISDWDDRLTIRRATLERQYTALETALSALNSQSSWLSSQIASLPTYS